MVMESLFFEKMECANDPRICVGAGQRRGEGIVSNGNAGCVAFGPYIRLFSGIYEILINICVTTGDHCRWDIYSGSRGETLFSGVYAEKSSAIVLLKQDIYDLEIRVFANDGDIFVVENISVRELAVQTLDDKTREAAVVVGRRDAEDLRILDALIKKNFYVNLSGECACSFGHEDIILLQTSDGERYRNILEVSGKSNSKFCVSHGLIYNRFVGLKFGVYPHHAMFNRVALLHDYVRGGFSGWVFYLDADALIVNFEFPLMEKLKLLRANGKHMWFHNLLEADEEGYYFGCINSGAFALDLGHWAVISLIKSWYEFYYDYVSANEWRLSNQWSDLIDDQETLHYLLSHSQFVIGNFVEFEQFQYGFVAQVMREKGDDVPAEEDIRRRRDKLLEIVAKLPNF